MKINKRGGRMFEWFEACNNSTNKSNSFKLRFNDPYENEVLNKNSDHYLEPDKIGSRIMPYKPTYNFIGSFINANHEFYAACKVKEEILIDLGISGWLRREDALKLMGYPLDSSSPKI